MAASSRIFPSLVDGVRPRILVSECLGFSACRYNGAKLDNAFVRTVGELAEYLPVCPEVGIGLGVPRDPIRLVAEPGGSIELLQPATGRLLGESMRSFAREYLDRTGELDGAILKSRSPSCGTKDVKIFSSRHPDAPPQGRMRGLFAENLVTTHPLLPVEDEGRMHNAAIREHFLVRVFLGAGARQLLDQPDRKALEDFHRRNKLLLMSYGGDAVTALGRIVASSHKSDPNFPDAIRAYRNEMLRATQVMPSRGRVVNVIQHAFGFFKQTLTSREKAHFLGVLEKYAHGQIPLRYLQGLLHAWILRFEDSYLADQTFFQPFPEELLFSES